MAENRNPAIMGSTQPIERTLCVRTPLHGQCREGHLASVNALSSEGNLLDNVGSAEQDALLCHADPTTLITGLPHL